MLERLSLVLLIGLLVTGGLLSLRIWHSRKLQRLRVSQSLVSLVPPGHPAIIAFSTPSCAECRTRQAPALARLTARLGEQVTIRSLSALDHPHLVWQLGILTVPATVVLDQTGTIHHLNLGYTSDQVLQAQVSALTQNR